MTPSRRVPRCGLPELRVLATLACASLLGACADGEALIGFGTDAGAAVRSPILAALASPAGELAQTVPDNAPPPVDGGAEAAPHIATASLADGAANDTLAQATRIALIAPEGPSAPQQAQAVTSAMRTRLTNLGYDLITPPDAVLPDDHIYFVDMRVETAAAAKGQETVAIDWLITDSAGEPIGKVSQLRAISGSASATQWQTHAQLAAAAAAEGIARLVPRQP